MSYMHFCLEINVLGYNSGELTNLFLLLSLRLFKAVNLIYSSQNFVSIIGVHIHGNIKEKSSTVVWIFFGSSSNLLLSVMFGPYANFNKWHCGCVY